MSEPNATLREAFRHHAWATRRLLAFVAGLPPEQLAQSRTAPLAGDTGSILETLDHIVCSDGSYLGALTGRRPAWAQERGLEADLPGMASLVDEAESEWMGLLAGADDAERTVFLDAGTYETRAAIVIAQALHHGSAHREQVCAILRELGHDPPELQPWDYADAIGRSRWVRPE